MVGKAEKISKVDINCDMGEGFGPYSMGNDPEMLKIVSTVNLACGFHAGDPSIMAASCRAAKEAGVALGAHPGYPDLWGFGRRSIPFTRPEIQELVAYQIGALVAIARMVGHRVTHVKAHGALGHLVADDPDAAANFAEVIRAIDPSLIISVMVGSRLERASLDAGLRIAREIYADRAYDESGRLVSRSLPGAIIHDPSLAAERVAQMIVEQSIVTVSGKRIPVEIDTVCVHGDTPDAVPIARAVKDRLNACGIVVAPYVTSMV